jgi:hypothetical protein
MTIPEDFNGAARDLIGRNGSILKLVRQGLDLSDAV